MSDSWWPTGEVSIADSTVASILRDAADAEACVEAEAVARTLAARFAPGERLAVLAPSTTEICLLSFAAAMARLVLVPVNPNSRPREIEHILRRSAAAAMVFATEYRGNDLSGALAALRPRLPDLGALIPLDGWAALVDEGSRLDGPLPSPEPDDAAQLAFTSGTTGAPKGVMLTHRGMTNASRLSGERFGIGDGDVYAGTIPLHHVGGQAVTFMAVQALATYVLVEQFDAAVQLELLESERATHTVGVPTMLHDVIAHPTFGERDLSALLQVRGPGVMRGYVDDPEQTAAALDPDGWLHTGDLVSMDARGYLTVTGRLKEMIVTGGVNVYPSEVEAVLAEHPAVAQIAVLGIPHPRWGGAGGAVVRCAPDATADAQELEAFGRERLASYKIPKQWRFTSELPMTASGKVQKHSLLQHFPAGSG